MFEKFFQWIGQVIHGYQTRLLSSCKTSLSSPIFILQWNDTKMEWMACWPEEEKAWHKKEEPVNLANVMMINTFWHAIYNQRKNRNPIQICYIVWLHHDQYASTTWPIISHIASCPYWNIFSSWLQRYPNALAFASWTFCSVFPWTESWPYAFWCFKPSLEGCIGGLKAISLWKFGDSAPDLTGSPPLDTE